MNDLFVNVDRLLGAAPLHEVREVIPCLDVGGVEGDDRLVFFDRSVKLRRIIKDFSQSLVVFSYPRSEARSLPAGLNRMIILAELRIIPREGVVNCRVLPELEGIIVLEN